MAMSRTAGIVADPFLGVQRVARLSTLLSWSLGDHAFPGDGTRENLTFFTANLEVAPDDFDQIEEVARWGGFEPPTS